MGNEDAGDPLAPRGAQDGRAMRRILRSGVEQRDLPPPDQPGVGAAEGERPGIAAEDAPHRGLAGGRGDGLPRLAGRQVVPGEEGDAHSPATASLGLARGSATGPGLARPGRMARPAPTMRSAPRIITSEGASPKTVQPMIVAQISPQ